MPIGLRWGCVTAVPEGVDAFHRVEVDGEPCVVVPRLTGPVLVGDMVLVSHPARGSAVGTAVVAVNLTRGLRLPPTDPATGVVWPLTPGQHAARLAEGDGAGLPDRLDGLTVVCCGLHGQVVPACAALRGRRAAYVQLGGGALPVSASDGPRALRARHVLETTIAVAPCVDAELQCVTAVGALAVAAARGVEFAVVSVGPAATRAGARWGDGGLAVAEAVHVAAALGARPLLAPIVERRPTSSSLQLSDRTRALLELCVGSDLRLAWPEEIPPPADVAVDVVDARGWRDACLGLPLATDGCDPDDEPWLFAAGYAAGLLARA